MNNLLAILGGGIIGYFLLKGKDEKKDDYEEKYSELLAKQKELEEREQEIENVEQMQIDDVVLDNVPQKKTEKPLYVGDKNKEYDPFYDYTDCAISQEDINAQVLASPAKMLRVRMIPEETFLQYQDGIETGRQDWGYVSVIGKSVRLYTTIEVFNPSTENVPISEMKVENITLNNKQLVRFVPDKDDVDYRSRRKEAMELALNRGADFKIFSYANDSETPEVVPAKSSLFQTISIDCLLKTSDIKNVNLHITDKYEYWYKIFTTDYESTYPNGMLSFSVLIHNSSYMADQYGRIDCGLYHSLRPTAENFALQSQKQYLGNLFNSLFVPKEKSIEEQLDIYRASKTPELLSKYFAKDIAEYVLCGAKNKINAFESLTGKDLIGQSNNVIYAIIKSYVGLIKRQKTLYDSLQKAYPERIVFGLRFVYVWDWYPTIEVAEKNAMEATNDVSAVPDSYKFWTEKND